MINFHAPFAVEDQITLLGTYSGNYVLDFRMNTTESAAIINSLGSYVYEGVPLINILSEYSSSYPKIYNNKVKYVILKKLGNLVFTPTVDLFLIECTNSHIGI